MDDLISRQAAIKALYAEIIKRRLLDDVNDGTLDEFDTESILRALPSVDSVPVVRGKWYKPSGMMPPEYAGAYRCSECDKFAMRDWKSHKQVLSDYCPHCGADMRGDTDGQN